MDGFDDFGDGADLIELDTGLLLLDFRESLLQNSFCCVLKREI
jgi:hypothetical protein